LWREFLGFAPSFVFCKGSLDPLRAEIVPKAKREYFRRADLVQEI
jgi:hypothetical protein